MDPHDDRKDSTMETSDDIQLPIVPIPFVVVEKVAGKEQPEYGDTESHPLATDVAKRTADFQPDFETTYEEQPADAEPPKSPEVPLLVVEKTDDRPAYGDDFGDDATTAQKVAHDMRAADALPDKLVVKPEGHIEPGTEEDQAAPLFRHELIVADEPPSTPALDTIDEVSIQSSTDQTSSEDIINTPSDPSESQDEDESNTEPLMPHEMESVESYTELENGPLLSHEADSEEEDELNNGPLLSHETGLNGQFGYSDEDEDVDELDAAPFLSHETGFSQYKGSEIGTKSDFLDDDVSEPRHYAYDDDDDDEGYVGRTIEPDEAPTFTHEDVAGEDNNYEEDDTPLLPHERDSAIHEGSSPEEEGRFILQGQPTFGYETDSANELFGGSGRPSIFRTRTNSSTLPHKLPPSDAEDENLHDPSLERFPTNRDQILQRVATISLHLPEDQTLEEPIHSPVMSVMSQACSSVDLAPVKSYTSLASVPEADDSDEEEDHADVESLPSPMVLNLGGAARDFARDPHATPMPNNNKRIDLAEDSDAQKRSDHTTRSSEAESVGKNDGAKDFALSKLHEAIATPAKVFNTITPPLTPEMDTSTSKSQAPAVSEPELRQRQVSKQDTPKDAPTPPATSEHSTENDRALKPSSSQQQLNQRNGNFLQSFFRVVFGPLGRFLTACCGDRKRAG